MQRVSWTENRSARPLLYDWPPPTASREILVKLLVDVTGLQGYSANQQPGLRDFGKCSSLRGFRVQELVLGLEPKKLFPGLVFIELVNLLGTTSNKTRWRVFLSYFQAALKFLLTNLVPWNTLWVWVLVVGNEDPEMQCLLQTSSPQPKGGKPYIKSNCTTIRWIHWWNHAQELKRAI